MQKKQPRSKSEIKEGMKRLAEVERMRSFVKETFYPALVKASTSIDDAKFLLGSFSNMVMEQFLAHMKIMKFKDLDLVSKLDPQSEQYEHFKAMVELFNDESVYGGRELIEGMKNEVNMMIDNELKTRKLDTLKTNFLE